MRLIYEENVEGEDFLELIIRKEEMKELVATGLCRIFPRAFSDREANILVRVQESIEDTMALAKKKPMTKKPASTPTKGATKLAKSGGTSTATETATKTSTSTDAYTQGNITVTGGAGKGATNVKIDIPRTLGATTQKKAKKK